MAWATTILFAFVLAATGFVGWRIDGRLAGWLLFVHVVAAPFFGAGLLLLALLAPDSPGGRANAVAALTRATWWVLLLAGLGTLVSILAAMMPVFGYIGQHALLVIHRASAIMVVIAALVYPIMLRIERRLWSNSQ